MNDLQKFAQRYPLTTLLVVCAALVAGLYFGAQALIHWVRG